MEKNIIKNNRFVAIDFETLESWRGSICELAVVVTASEVLKEAVEEEVETVEE